MATGTISIPLKVIDVKLVYGTFGSLFTVNAHTAMDAASKVGSYTIPDGYTEVLWWIDINGDARVQNAGLESTWIANTSASNSNNIHLRRASICVKYG